MHTIQTRLELTIRLELTLGFVTGFNADMTLSHQTHQDN